MLALLIGLVAVVVIIRVILDPLATHFTRQALNEMEGWSGDFARVHVAILSPGYEITRIKLFSEPRTGAREPLFYADRIHVGADWRALLRGRLLGRVRIDHPKIAIEAPPQPEPEKTAKIPPDLLAQLRKATALEVDRVEVFGGEMLFRQPAGPRQPEIWLHELELAAENLATRRELGHGRPATVVAHGVLGHSGDVALFVSADPQSSPLGFAGRVVLKNVELRDAVATVIPFEGRITDPGIQLWPAVLGVVRNALVRGLASGTTASPKTASPARD